MTLKRTAIIALIIGLALTSTVSASAMKTLHLKGKVFAVHADRHTIEVEKKSGELQTVYLTDATRYVLDNVAKTLTDLKKGTPVSVHYALENGRMTASKVVIQPSKSGKLGA